MSLSVQFAARRLGVSPHTIRRWTSSGFLPCTRTAGGHRRIREEDIDELADFIGGRNHLAERLARERELDTLVDTALTVSGRLEATDLMREIARQLTTLLDAHCCVISEYDPGSRTVSVLAEYDLLGNRRPDRTTYTLSRFPMARKAIEDHETIVVNVGDPHADRAEVAVMRRDGDQCLLIVPLLYQGESVGLLEVLDHLRERRFSRQEMRLAHAVAGQAGMALHNTKVFSQLRRSDEHGLALRNAVKHVSAGYGRFRRAETEAEVLQHAASLAANAAHVVVTSAQCGDDTLTLTLTLGRPAGEALPELAELIATMAAWALRDLRSPDETSTPGASQGGPPPALS